ncbi:hypothetical protein, partial [Salmonella enterica]|uniref:hypothetical protein n=1 Tax=Salmonella enterica TaxID=28901 RepID=UPI001C2F9429
PQPHFWLAPRFSSFSLFLSFSLFFSLFLNLISHTKVKQGTRRREAEAYSCPSPSLHDGLNLSTM